MIKLILFWRQGEKADWQRQILKETEGWALCQMKETQMTSWGYEVHSLGMIGNCLVNAQLPDFKVNNADQALGRTFHYGVKIRAVFPAE